MPSYRMTDTDAHADADSEACKCKCSYNRPHPNMSIYTRHTKMPHEYLMCL